MGDAARATAAPNIALIKYWGKEDRSLNSPAAGSISLTLSSEILWARTEIAVEDTDCTKEEPTLIINGTEYSADKALGRFVSGFLQCIDLVGAPARPGAPTQDSVRQRISRLVVRSQTNIPVASGVASSAAGAAALARAMDAYFSTGFDRQILSCLARLYSGSGARSIYPGAVEMACDPTRPALLQWHSLPLPVHPLFHSLECLIAMFSADPKSVSSTDAMNKCNGHPLQLQRLAAIPSRLARCKKALQDGNFDELASVSEEDWQCMHRVIAAAAGVEYITAEGRLFAKYVADMRTVSGVQVFCTFDAGPNCVVFGFPDALKLIQEQNPAYKYIQSPVTWSAEM